MLYDNYVDYQYKNNKNMRRPPLRNSFHSLEARQKDELNRNLLNYDLAESVFFEVATNDSEPCVEERRVVLFFHPTPSAKIFLKSG